MRIKELKLKDWQVIRQADFSDLGDFVVIAGPNGVGKTKVKDAIVHIFQNNGNPPNGSSVILESTNDEERQEWKSDEVSLPQNFFTSFFQKNYKRLKTKSRLIQIDSNRNVENVQFEQLTFQSIGNPETEDIGYNYGYNLVRDRFKDICKTLHRLKSKEVTSVYQEYNSNISQTSTLVTLNKLADPTEKYIEVFGQLLYPKKMLPIDINSSTIQYKDEDGNTRQFSELSSGEREVVILTFDILTQNPFDCLILIDEPEVHLHPELTFRLIKVLKSIGERNQYFLFTHSPDIIGNSFETGVYFIRPKSRVSSGNQVVKIDESNINAFKSIPNIRETIGMVSVGKKLLFVEGNNSTSIDRNVFATISKASKVDVAIIPSNSCSNINNMSLVTETLEKGLFGVELFMVRDRDGLTEEQVSTYTTKSKGRLIFLPFYHIENAFLVPQAIHHVATQILRTKAPSLNAIENKLVELARQQINHTITLYVKSEIYFKAGNFDLTPNLTINGTTTILDLKTSMSSQKKTILQSYDNDFSDSMIEGRLTYWKTILDNSIKYGWSSDARKFFIGKRMLKEIQSWLFGTKSISIWEHIVDSSEPSCRQTIKELEEILKKI